MSPGNSAICPGAQPQFTAGPGLSTTDTGEHLAEQIKHHLERHLDEPLGLTDIARAFGCSVSQVSASFRRKGKASPMKALAALRMRRAQNLLQNTDSPIMQIAQAVGHGDQASFTHFFRRHAGKSPREFRENHRWLL